MNPITSTTFTSLPPTLFPANAALLDPNIPETRKRYKDLLIFEERLRWNANTHQANRRLWLAILLLLFLTFAFSGYLLTTPTTNALALYIFVASSVVLLLFFALGLYQSRLRDPRRFRPMLNKVLKHYCLELHAKNNDLVFSRKVNVGFAEGYSQYRREAAEDITIKHSWATIISSNNIQINKHMYKTSI
ncbi:hypothetical protein BDR26DRAFT_46236 [Obelidium mucronatum]|nr:hypothetical protein BDR26DRAFT_46236 [Obelidium mucronatum]